MLKMKVVDELHTRTSSSMFREIYSPMSKIKCQRAAAEHHTVQFNINSLRKYVDIQ